MELLYWDNAFSVKNDTIDEQHKKLFVLINELNKHIINNDSTIDIPKLIRRLKEYIVFHFKTEEAYLTLSKFPALDSHKKEHEKFVEKVSDLEEQYNNGNTPNPAKIAAFLNAWINYHIKESDQAYADYLPNDD